MTVFIYSAHRFLGSSANMFKAFVDRVVFVNAILCTYPYQLIFVLQHAVDMIVAKTFWIGRIFEKDFESISIKPVQSIARAEPHKSFFILENTKYVVVGEAVFYCVVPEIVAFLRQGSNG